MDDADQSVVSVATQSADYATADDIKVGLADPESGPSSRRSRDDF
jgi:hypothetical protein